LPTTYLQVIADATDGLSLLYGLHDIKYAYVDPNTNRKRIELKAQDCT